MIDGVKRLSDIHTEEQQFQVKFQMVFGDDFRAEKCILDPYTRSEAMLVDGLRRE